MRLFRHIVLANMLAAILLAGVVIALRPRDVQSGVVSRGNAIGIGRVWTSAPPAVKGTHSQCSTRRAPDSGEIYIHVELINCAALAPSPVPQLPREMHPDEL